MTILKRLLCLIGIHHWQYVGCEDIPGSGFTDDPADYECGGIVYFGSCSRCKRKRSDAFRGVWIKPEYVARAESVQ